MSFTIVSNQVMAIFMIIIIGYIAKKLGYVNRQVTKGISEILLNIAIPAIVLSSFNKEIPQSALKDVGIVMVFAFAAHALSAAAARYLFQRYPLSTRQVMSFVIVFTNSGN